MEKSKLGYAVFGLSKWNRLLTGFQQRSDGGNLICKRLTVKQAEGVRAGRSNCGKNVAFHWTAPWSSFPGPNVPKSFRRLAKDLECQLFVAFC